MWKLVLHLFVVLTSSVWSSFAQSNSHTQDQCHPWSFYNYTLQECQCYERPDISDRYVTVQRDVLQCSKKKVLLNILFRMTDEKEGTFIGAFHTSNLFTQNVTVVDGLYLQLPNNMTELNDFMCGPINRRGRLCGECADGFGPSVISGNECAKCTGAWYVVPLYLLLEVIPITIFYLIVLLFQISLTSSPLTFFVMYCQMANYVFSQPPISTLLQSKGGVIFWKILITFHGMWNLDFFNFVIPSFCVSPNLKLIHVHVLGYISALYPLLLIVLTWVSVQVHSRHFKLLVWLWNKVNWAFIKAKEDSKTTMTDIFATFFLLSYTKFFTISMMALGYVRTVRNDSHKYFCVSADPRILYLSREHIPYAIIAVIVFLVFGLLPALLLVVYPVRKLRSLLLFDRLGGRFNAALNVFVEKFYNCYRDGLDGERDMRSFASLHLFVRMLGGFVGGFTFVGSTIFFGGCSLLVFLVRPCKRSYTNNIEALILALMALNSFQLFILFSEGHSQLHIWSLFISSCLPLSAIYFNIIPYKYRMKLKGIGTKALCSIWKILCCCLSDGGFYKQEPLDSDVPDNDQMIRYSGGDSNDSSEQGALLRNPKLLYTYN